MFKNVLVGIDERSRGRDAVALAVRLVAPDGELRFAHVHPGFAFPGKGDNGEFEAIERQAALELVSSVIAESGVEAQAHCLGAPRIGVGLRQVAEATGADLLVIGSSHESPRGRVWLRDEVRQTLNGAPCAVAVAPLAYAELGTPITQIGIAFNGSDESHNALAVGLELARDLGASASAFQALPVPVLGDGYALYDSAEAAYRELEDEARELIHRETGVNGCAAIGDPISELSVFSAGVDLLIVGSRDFGPLGRLVHGSTTHDLLGHARSPLLILTRASRARQTKPPALTAPAPAV